jgi:hypothetical protein
MGGTSFWCSRTLDLTRSQKPLLLLPYSAAVTHAFVLIRPMFIDVLAKVGYVEDTTPFVESR